jgi:hypothetical protein
VPSQPVIQSAPPVPVQAKEQILDTVEESKTIEPQPAKKRRNKKSAKQKKTNLPTFEQVISNQTSEGFWQSSQLSTLQRFFD